jgi:uncharacterized MAPEG superfamily protein
VQFALYSVAANRQVGPRYALGPRDAPRALTGIPGRLQRALQNHFEGLILFTLAVVVVKLSDRSSGVTQACAWIYLAARVAYIPAYAFALSPWRSLIWAAGFLATVAMIVAALV